MALTVGSYLLGSHVYFFRSGDSFTVPTSGTCGRSAKPGAADTGWIDLGIIEECSLEGAAEEIEIFAPLPGRLRLYDKIAFKDKVNLKFTCSQLTPLAIETMMRTLALTTSSTQFNPLEGTASKQGWLKLQAYDQADAQRLLLDMWSFLKCTNGLDLGGGALAKPQFEADLLHSIYNTGTL